MEAGCVVAAVIENAASGPQREPGSSVVLEGDLLPSTDLEKDDGLPQVTNIIPPGEKQPQEASTALMKSDDITEHPAEPLLRSCVSTASMKVKNMKKLTFPRGHFPRLAECAHFHYETVDFGNIQLALAEGQNEGPKPGLDSKELVFLVQITCQGRNWLVKRSYEDFRVLDKHLHLCIYDRRYSHLTELPRYDTLKDTVELVATMLNNYLSRFSAIADNKINCGPVLTWMEIDNKGNHLLVSEEASINVPAIAAAHVTKRYTAQATDELTFEVGDIVSVIDMPPKEDTGWWRGKHGFQVGFFPCDCVELINEKIPPSVQNSVPKPVCKKHGKLVTFLRSFMKSRPPPQKLRQRGILKERVFGCDLGEHLHNSGHDVPQVVKSCAEFIEKNGVVDGIYRLSGISSNIQKLRHEFDSEQIPDLTRDVFRQDIHSVGSLCKLYFRELPNPLLTYQLYERFSEAVSAATEEERLVKIHNVIQQLPPPHYRTLEYLMRHLSRLATFSSVTNMHTKNLAIVWAPNLLRSRQIESACFSGTAAFMEVRIQSVVVEFILNNTESLFSSKLNAIIRESTGNNTLSRPKSLMVCSPSTKLLSLEEAQARNQTQLGSPATTPSLNPSDYIEVGEGPEALLGKFHTVIELPTESGKRSLVKSKKSPVGNWLSFFHLGKSHSVSKRKLKRHPSEPNEIKSIALPGGRGDSGTMRSTKSEESLTSLQNLEPPSYRPLRPRSTSEAISATSRDDLHNSRGKEDRQAHQPNESKRSSDRGRRAVTPNHSEDDLDLSPPAAGISSLDFDPMSFQCSQTPAMQHGRDGNRWRKGVGCSGESEPASSQNNFGCTHSPDVSPALCKSGKKVSLKHLSPKVRKKSLKLLADVQTPVPSSSPNEGKWEAAVADGKEPRATFQHSSPINTASQASAATDLSQTAQNLPDPGTDRLMSSVSVLPPHPPSMSAARKLALALAESAHQASNASHRRSHAHNHRLQRPSVLDLKAHPQEYRGPRGSSGSQWQTAGETHRSPNPVQFSSSHICSERFQVGESQESVCNFTPNVSPLGSGSLDEGSAEGKEQREERETEFKQEQHTYQSVGVSTPCQPFCSARSPTASPVYANTDSVDAFNFRSVLAEPLMPASIKEVFPRQLQTSSAHHYSPEEDSPPGFSEDAFSNHHHHPQYHHRPLHLGQTPAPPYPRPSALPPHLSGHKGLYRQSSDSHYSSLGLRQPLSPQYRRYRGDLRKQHGQWQSSEDRVARNPAIRRAHSFHAPQISHYELANTEILPVDAMFYVEQKRSPELPYQGLIQAGLNPVRTQFQNLLPEHQYHAGSNAENPRSHYFDPRRQSGIHRQQTFSVHSTREGEPSEYYNYSPRHIPPVNRELYIKSRDTVVYEARDAEVFERVIYQPVQQETHKGTYHSVSPCETPDSPRDIMHTRSKSDPGNGNLLSAHNMEGETAVTTSPTSPGMSSQQGFPEVSSQRRSHRSGAEFGPVRRIHIKEDYSQQPLLRKVPSLPDRGCPNLKNIELTHRCQARGYGQDESLLAGAENPSILRRPMRSQSTREHRHYYHYPSKSPLDPGQMEPFPAQFNRRTQSTKVKPTQYDHMEGYYAAPRSKSTRSGKSARGYLPGQSCMSPRGQRLLSNVLVHEGFYHPALRSEGGGL
ncbi:PREDICTED: rho GTPase-activating protein 32-like isoform X1 [Cyprinodon variegatus]|uniref:rho GTPase-activating protein 32-like isoform X1 n=2 Tax=Cyprinodon variegatus TaxID=28743 RepID=UPI000742A22B|nr:PREDICTED: rho GTPase-activating protein 32-like isoform X1 [Cyprinodon variegatus]